MSEESDFWYGENAATEQGRRVLEALRVYQAAESAMRRRSREAMSMGENDILVLRYLIRAAAQHVTTTPTDIARYLGITTAATTALIDRLERSGHLTRERHPTDRRSVVITATAQTDDDVRAAVGGMHERMLAATRDLTDGDAETIIAFLERVQAAVDEIAVDDAQPARARHFSRR